MARCRWHTDKQTGERFHVPGCWSAVHDPWSCDCPRSERSQENYENEVDEIEKLTERVEELERIVRDLRK